MEQKLEACIATIRPPAKAAQQAAQARQAQLTKPAGSLGRLEALSVQVAGITAQVRPRMTHKCIVVMAADHGVTAEGISAFPASVTAQMVTNFLHGGAAINVLARHVGARMVVVDMGVAGVMPEHVGLRNHSIRAGTRNMVAEPAMTRDEALAALVAGIDIVEDESAQGLDVIGVGEMGIGNTTAAAAVASILMEIPPSVIVGRGTGIDDRMLAHKIAVVEQALAKQTPDASDPIDVLAKVGGYEIAGLAGVMLAAASRRCPVVVDGFITTAAAMVAVTLAPALRPYLIAAHLSAERGHELMLEWLGLQPLLALEMRLGEGSGAALGISLVEAACRLLDEMATFEEAAVSGRENPRG